MNAFIGLDISKDLDISKETFDACLLRESGKPLFKAFPNTQAGFAKLLRWVQSQAPAASGHFCLEATGAYSEALALFLAEAQQRVSVVNPAWIKYAGMSQGQRNKTDKADARRIADYCRKEQPAPWRMSAPEVRTLVALVRRLESVQEMLHQEQNRLSVPGLLVWVENSLRESIAFLQAQAAALQRQINDPIDAHPALRADKELLLSIPGVGEVLAQWLLAQLPDVKQFQSAQAVAAFAGLNPRECRSGSSVRRPTRLSKAGNARLRKALYMPALSAIGFNPAVKELFERLVKRGMVRKAALCAAMRKLLMSASGVLKSRQKFAFQSAQTNT